MTSFKALYERYWMEQPGNGAPGAPPPLDETLECLAPILDRGVLLDVGCGPGGVMAVARGRCRAMHGCDVSEVAARRARAAGVSAVCADLNEALPYRAEAFDWVTCLEVIEHVVDPLRLLREVRRVLRPGGALVLSTPNIRYLRNVGRLVWRGEFPHTTTDTFVWGGGHIHYFTRRDLGTLLAAAGFADTRFVVNREQFARSWKRRTLVRLVGQHAFGEWMCGGIVALARKA